MRLYRRIWLGTVRSATPAIPPGAIVFAAHYNGAVDGFAYGSQLPDFVAVVSVQWHRLPLGRWFWPGIPITRSKDQGNAASNATAFRAIFRALAEGERLLFFPEGTSRLGLERLPIQPGTLLLLRKARTLSPPPAVYFVAAHYHAPTLWRAAVTLGWAGPVALPDDPAHDAAWVAENLRRAQSAAYALPPPPPGRWRWLGAALALPYLPVWGLVARGARRCADEDNVLGLWKFLLGVPITVLALGAFTLGASRCGLPGWLPLVSLTGGWWLWKR